MEKEKINYKYTVIDDYNCKREIATQEEIESGRELFIKTAQNNPKSIGMRTCYACNSAHAHLMEDFIFICIECNKKYANGVDLMDYEEE